MKKALTIVMLGLSSGIVFSQPRMMKMFEYRYDDLQIKNRIENSGIYGIASFDRANDEVFLSTFDSPEVIRLGPPKLDKQSRARKIGFDALADVQDAGTVEFVERKQFEGRSANLALRKTFLDDDQRVFSGEGGEYSDRQGERILVTVPNRNTLTVRFALDGFRRDFTLKLPSTLAFADLIGVDRTGNSFLLLETYLSEIPLAVQREVYTLSPSGTILSILEIPSVKYCSTLRDFQIDAAGNLYHLMTERESFSVLKWSRLTTPTAEKIKYPERYNYKLHFNDIVPAQESSVGSVAHPATPASRSLALHIGESYVLHKYFCSPANLTVTDKTAPDGDVVRTPAWLIVGENARVAYKWGGFNTLEQYDAGLKTGKFAADINTNGVSSYAVGVDCSGFVSRCWQLTYHSSTSDMPGITTQYPSWDSLKPGDAIHKVGHVRLFVEKAQNGALKVVESSGRDWGVSYWTYTPSELTGTYTPRFYTGMVNDYSTKRPELLSVVTTSPTSAQLLWKCDTSNVLGYKVYRSTDGITWTLFQDESSLKSTSISVDLDNAAAYYRVSSVLNNGSRSESNWSNAMGTANFSSGKKYLIVDGFTRENASWRGAGHLFAARYGASISKDSAKFESARNSELLNGSITLNAYDGIFWILGDEGSANETFSSQEQALVKNYLENGGKLFVSGSEIGWDLVNQGTAEDKKFYNDYLKATFVADDAGATAVSGVPGTALAGADFVIGQTYEEDYPDEVGTYGGATLCMRYANTKGAGVEFEGPFGSSMKNGKLIHLAFALETTANDSAFDLVIGSALKFFSTEPTLVTRSKAVPQVDELTQNYPNPFNPATNIRFVIGEPRFVSLKVLDILGREVATLVNEERPPGSYEVRWDAGNYPSGTYFLRLSAGDFTQVRRMVLLR